MLAQIISSSRQLTTHNSALLSPLRETCRGPEQCQRKMQAMQRRMQRKLPLVLAQYEELIRFRQYRVSKHVEQRMEERGISYKEVIEVLEAYQPVEWSDLRTRQTNIESLGRRVFDLQPYHITVTGEAEIYGDRPLCIGCAYGERPRNGSRWELHILTVYDPSTQPQKWDIGYSRRICFCNNEPSAKYVSQKLDHYYRYADGCETSSPSVYSTAW